ncbi:MAG: hypothetical protein ISS63_04535 [Desulfobacteraceae bacterium]|nr:hypothetical protein [Desulfobacteraceae bacterium]
MDNVSEKSVVRKAFKDMVVLGLGLAVTIGLTPVTTWASFQNQAEQSCRFNGQSQNGDGNLTRIFRSESIIMARGGNRSGGGRGGGAGMGQRGDDNSESGYRYGPGDGTGTGEGPEDGTGYGAKKGGGTGDCDGTGPKEGKGRGNRRN